MNPNTTHNAFHGIIANEYQILQKICPAITEINHRLGDFITKWTPNPPSAKPKVLEIGCGTGMTTLSLLNHCPSLPITSLDSSPVMLNQARRNLAGPLEKGNVRLVEIDALTHLRAAPAASLDIVASGYVLHNFLNDYRDQVLKECFRVLKPGGLFLNGDRYALDDTLEHLRLIQAEAGDYFRVLRDINRLDLLETWILHLFSDESPDHVMRLRPALDYMAELGFQPITVHFRDGVNALVSGVKPWP